MSAAISSSSRPASQQHQLPNINRLAASRLLGRHSERPLSRLTDRPTSRHSNDRPKTPKETVLLNTLALSNAKTEEIENSRPVYQRQVFYFRNPDLIRYLQGAENGVLFTLKHYLEISKSLKVDDICEETERTALMLSCMNGHQHCVEYLIDMGANVNAKTYVGMTPILAAAGVATHVKIVQLLLNNGANIEASDHSFFTPLLSTAEKGCLPLVEFLLSRGANVQAVSQFGFSSLNYAVANGHLDVAETLIKHDADVQRKDGDGFTPLMRSTTNGYYHICEMLIERHARINEADDIGGNTSLHFATSHPRLMAYYLSNGAYHSPINKNGDTPLMLASSRGDFVSLKMLVTAGGSIHYINKFDQSALSLAAINNQYKIFQYLIDLGGEDDIVDYDGSNILMLAAASGSVEVVAYLLQRTKPQRLRNSLRHALVERQRSTTKFVDRIAITTYLQDKQSYLEHKNKLGNNAFLCAAKNRQLEMIVYLAEEGSNVEVQNNDGTTALMYASQNGDVDLVKYLCEVGCVSLDTTNHQHQTARQLAKNDNIANLLEYFKEIRIILLGKPEFVVPVIPRVQRARRSQHR